MPIVFYFSIKKFLIYFTFFILFSLLGVLILQLWANDKIEKGNLIIQNKEHSTQNIYNARIHFQRLDFLLRAGNISKIYIQNIILNNNNNLKIIENKNRYLYFSSEQRFEENQNVGFIEYKMDFNPLLKTIFKFYGFVILILSFFLCSSFIFHFIENNENNLNNKNNKNLKKLFLTIFNIFNQNWILKIKLFYSNIPFIYRQTFYLVFFITNAVFLFYTVQFLYGNHDWRAIYESWGLFIDIWCGRYTEILLSLGLQNGMVLPILNNVLAFLALSLAAVVLCVYLNVPQERTIWLIAALLLVIQPFTNARLYYIYQAGGLFFGVLFGITGMYLAKKEGENTKYKLGGGGVKPFGYA